MQMEKRETERRKRKRGKEEEQKMDIKGKDGRVTWKGRRGKGRKE